MIGRKAVADIALAGGARAAAHAAMGHPPAVPLELALE